MKKNPTQWTIIASVTINAEVSIVSAVIGEREMFHTRFYILMTYWKKYVTLMV